MNATTLHTVTLQTLIAGDAAVYGDYYLHSAFEKVCNFMCHDKLLFVAAHEIYLSPASLIINGFDIHSLSNIKLYDGAIFFNGIQVVSKNKTSYNSLLSFDNKEKEHIIDKCINLCKEIISFFPADGMKYIFEEHSKNIENNSFKRLLQQKILQGITKLLDGHILSGIMDLRGVGYGLTPSGDDFITGMLYGLHFYKNRELSKYWQGQIYQAALGNNIFVNNNLYHALQGNYNLRFKNFILSLLKNDENERVNALKQLIAIGATSGADLLAGFIFTLINRNQIENSFSKQII